MRHRFVAAALATVLSSCAASQSMPSADAAAAWVSQPMIDREVPVVFDVDAGLDTHMIARPAELAAVPLPLPVVLWENGSCSWDNVRYRPFLSRLAASGVIVLVKGGAGRHMESPRPPGTPVYFEYVEQMKRQQLAALDWLVAQGNDPASPLYRKVDGSRVAAMGYSCGALPAVENAAIDHRIRSILFFNSGVRPGLSNEAFHAILDLIPRGTPIGFVDGGETDMAARSGQDTFDRLPAGLPVFFANWQGPGHEGFWRGENSAAYQAQLARLAINWIDYTLVSGSARAGADIRGTNCQLCGNPDVTIQQKHWDAFTPPRGIPGTAY